jgi:subtilisin family serine protease
MKTLFPILSALLLFFTVSTASAREYVVLFKAPELQNLLRTRIQNRPQFEQRLRTANRESLRRVARTIRSEALKLDLWLIRGGMMDLTDAEAKLVQSQPEIEQVLPNRRHQWIHEPIRSRRGQVRAAEKDWNLKAIKLPELRKAYPSLFYGQGVRVGVLDTGIQSKHAEFSSLSGLVFKDFVNHLTDPYDDNGHGTHVSGTIAGVKVGIAPRVSMVVGKVFDASGSATDAMLIEAMQWIFDPDNNPATADFPKVVNNSWGGDLDSQPADIRPFAAYRRALGTWIAGGMIPVFAAGNSGERPNGIPGGLPEAIAIGSIDTAGVVSEFSSRGPNLWNDGVSTFSVAKPDVSAPGEEIYSAVPGNSYQVYSGTSMATPHITGALALLAQVAPQMDVFQSHDLLIRSVTRKGDPSAYGWGTLDVLALIQASMTRH